MREETLEHVRHVSRAPGRGIVSRVADEVRTGTRREPRRDAPIGVARRDAEREIGARVPVALGESARFAQQPFRVGPGDDDRGAATRLVGPGIADPHGSVDDPGLRLDRRKAPVDAARRLVPRTGPFTRQQHRNAHPRFPRTHPVP